VVSLDISLSLAHLLFCGSKLKKILILGAKAVKAVDQIGIDRKQRKQQGFYG
jgi:hypothetical protein